MWVCVSYAATRAWATVCDISWPSTGQIVTGIVPIAVNVDPAVSWIDLFVDGLYDAQSSLFIYVDSVMVPDAVDSFLWNSGASGSGPHVLSAVCFDETNTLIGESGVVVIVKDGLLSVTTPQRVTK